jgi:hypothetical protein
MKYLMLFITQFIYSENKNINERHSQEVSVEFFFPISLIIFPTDENFIAEHMKGA